MIYMDILSPVLELERNYAMYKKFKFVDYSCNFSLNLDFKYF